MATLSRRQFVAAMGGAVLCHATSAPNVYAKKSRTLRVLGTHVTLQETLRLKAQEDLGITIEFSPGGSAEVLHQASTRPESFDLYEQWSGSVRILWQANTIQPIETRRIAAWDQINDLAKVGKISPQARFGAGDAPNKLLYVQKNNAIGGGATEQVSFLPYVHNVDSFGYNADVVPRGKPYQTESWSWLVDDRWRGKSAFVNAPTIGPFDAALAVQAAGLAEFEDVGNMTRPEIDNLFRVLIDLRRAGHFRGVWSSVPHSVDLMATGDVVVESMFSPAVFALKEQGIDCVYASPKEGYRAWHGVVCLSSATQGDGKDIAYEYMNWWLSGWPGAFIARQGYYISNPEQSRPHLSSAEWNYWYEGKPASESLPGTSGKTVVPKGEVRDGGSYRKRFENVAVWNTVMNNYEYTLPQWNAFLSAV